LGRNSRDRFSLICFLKFKKDLSQEGGFLNKIGRFEELVPPRQIEKLTLTGQNLLVEA